MRNAARGSNPLVSARQRRNGAAPASSQGGRRSVVIPRLKDIDMRRRHPIDQTVLPGNPTVQTSGSLGRSIGDDLSDLLFGGSCIDQGADQQIDRHRRITRLHLRHAGLAGSDACSEGFLGDLLGTPTRAKLLRQGNSQLDHCRFRCIQQQESFASPTFQPARSRRSRFALFIIVASASSSVRRTV